MREVKDLVRAARKQQGLSLQQLADRLGVCRSLVGHWECGRYVPPDERAVCALAAALELDPNELTVAVLRAQGWIKFTDHLQRAELPEATGAAAETGAGG